ncbi:MAG: Flagellar assembly factor FliW [Firmicutes bacterium]|nr:Flagellar assembly factor FliW [candidate division NPL-UPA2 bacterium]
MLVNSSRLGEVTVQPGDLISFPSGFIGLPEWQSAVLVPFSPEVPLLTWLQFTHDADAAFLLLDVAEFAPDYDVPLAQQEAELSEASRVFTIVSVPAGDFSRATTNLLAPVVIEPNPGGSPLGKQVVLHETSYPLRHPLFGRDD